MFRVSQAQLPLMQLSSQDSSHPQNLRETFSTAIGDPGTSFVTQPTHHFGAELELVDDKGEGNVTLPDPPQDGADHELNVEQEDPQHEPELVTIDILKGCANLRTSIPNAGRIPEEGELCDDININLC